MGLIISCVRLRVTQISGLKRVSVLWQGRSLDVAAREAMDKPKLIIACVVGGIILVVLVFIAIMIGVSAKRLTTTESKQGLYSPWHAVFMRRVRATMAVPGSSHSYIARESE